MKKINKIVGIALKRASGPALHKYNPYISYMCGHIAYQERKKKSNADIVEW